MVLLYSYIFFMSWHSVHMSHWNYSQFIYMLYIFWIPLSNTGLHFCLLFLKWEIAFHLCDSSITKFHLILRFLWMLMIFAIHFMLILLSPTLFHLSCYIANKYKSEIRDCCTLSWWYLLSDRLGHWECHPYLNSHFVLFVFHFFSLRHLGLLSQEGVHSNTR